MWLDYVLVSNYLFLNFLSSFIYNLPIEEREEMKERICGTDLKNLSYLQLFSGRNWNRYQRGGLYSHTPLPLHLVHYPCWLGRWSTHNVSHYPYLSCIKCCILMHCSLSLSFLSFPSKIHRSYVWESIQEVVIFPMDECAVLSTGVRYVYFAEVCITVCLLTANKNRTF